LTGLDVQSTDLKTFLEWSSRMTRAIDVLSGSNQTITTPLIIQGQLSIAVGKTCRNGYRALSRKARISHPLELRMSSPTLHQRHAAHGC
jgi:hypothetical protein